MPYRLFCLLLLVALVGCQRPITTTRPYFPPAGPGWATRNPAMVGFDTVKLKAAVDWAKTQETSQMKPDFSTQEIIFGKLLGPLPKSRAATNGLIIRHGYIVAEWGDTEAADPTYSAAKSVLSTILGISIERGLVRNLTDTVATYIHDGGYDSTQNRAITWEHHARQTSEWTGSLWGKNADFVGTEAFGQGERKPRTLQQPGTFYEYNDVRVNRLALSLLRLWKRPLPDVFRTEIMRPIGASDSWRWVPYPNAVAEVDGQLLPSVSGGTRWGGGLWISARDEARFGYLFLRKGHWNNRQIVSETWVKQATTRGSVGPDYGLLWWLNTEGNAWPGCPTSSFAALGAGSNAIFVDPEHDLVIVWRWHNGSPGDLAKRVIEAIK
jgi:CubicO group peptidase (beta-lactamase class C family)